MKTSVAEHLITPLTQALGQPAWEEDGKNVSFIRRQWQESFQSFLPQQLADAATWYIRNGKDKWPSIAEIFKILEGEVFRVAKKKIAECHNSVMEDYNSFCIWHHEVIHGSKYPTLMTTEKSNILHKHIKYYESMQEARIFEYDGRYRTICGLFFRDEWHIQVENRFAELAIERKRDTMTWLRKVHFEGASGTSLSNMVAKICLARMPDDVRRELNINEGA